jgi:hypothetical protein
MKTLSQLLNIKYLLLFILFLTINLPVFADVKINEFLIEPDPQTVELLNTGLEAVDISNWYLDDSGGTTFYTIPENTIIFPNSCYVFSGNLYLNKASSDVIRLFNKTAEPTSQNAVLVDSYDYNKSPGLNISFARVPDGTLDWKTAQPSFGFFNESLLNCIYIISPTSTLTSTSAPSPILTPTLTIIPTPTPITYDLIENIYISEVMVAPENENEWIEIYNDNNFDVTLNDWYIDDIENAGSVPKKINIKILSKSYRVIEITSSIFNNLGDTVRLLDNSNSLKDSFSYSSSEKGKTFGRINLDDDIFCLQNPSKGTTNNSCIDEESESNVTLTTSSTKNPIISKNSLKNQISNDIQVSAPKKYFPTIMQNRSEVLGATTTVIKFNSDSNNLLIKLLSLNSLSYSLLTLLSISLKIKISV